MRSHTLRATVLVLGSIVCGCGGGSRQSTPAPTPTPQPPANHAPEISALTITPSSGVQDLTQFAAHAASTDADGDTVSLTWNVLGKSLTGPDQAFTAGAGGTHTLTVTATDAKGAGATRTAEILVKSMTGTWKGTIEPFKGTFTFKLTQKGEIVTGTFVDPFDRSGKTDPASPGRVDAQGEFRMRWKIGPFLDFTMTGRFDADGQKITGGTRGSGFHGEPFSLVKE